MNYLQIYTGMVSKYPVLSELHCFSMIHLYDWNNYDIILTSLAIPKHLLHLEKQRSMIKGKATPTCIETKYFG